METGVTDFRNLGDADLLGLALEAGRHAAGETESQDLLQPCPSVRNRSLQQLEAQPQNAESDEQLGARIMSTQELDAHLRQLPMDSEPQPDPRPPLTEHQVPGADTVVQPGSIESQEHPEARLMSTQELDSQLRRMPIDSEPQPDLRPPLPPQQQTTHISATPSALEGSCHASFMPAGPPDSLDTFALDQALLAMPLETQDLDADLDAMAANVAQEAAGAEATGGPSAAPARQAGAPQSFGNGSEGLGDGGVYLSSQALDDALRAVPIGSTFDDDMQPPPPEVEEAAAGATARGAEASAAAPPASSTGEAGAQQPQPPNWHPKPGSAADERPAAPSGWHDFGDYGAGGSFDDELEDYLAAQAAEAEALQRQPPPAPQPLDIDELDDLIAELQHGGAAHSSGAEAVATAGITRGGASSAGSSQRGRMGTAAAAAGANLVDRSQETVQVLGAQRQAKRPSTEARGRPTMEELFGSDEEDAAPAEAAAARPAGAKDVAGRKACAAAAVEEDEEEEVLHARRAFFPPQRLASSIHDGTALPVTAASGERVYCRLADVNDGAARGGGGNQPPAQLPCGGGAAVGGRRRGRNCLLAMPLADMLRELEDRQLRVAIATSDREEQRRREQRQHPRHPRQGDQGFTEEDRAFAGMAEDGAAATARPDADGGAAAAPALGGRGGRRASGAAARDPLAQGVGLEETMLWVDKYAPRHFMSLLSDERTNRQVALWVKDWDECVFGRAGGASGAATKSKAAAATRKLESRPQHKVLLIGGPPGLGKTTLAHVVARHCGYHPYEINASDDRTAATLLTKIQDAVQMTAVLGGGRPNCVIVDEVDGATGGSETGGAVAALLKLIRAGEAAAARGDGRGGGNAAGTGDDGSDGEDEEGGGEGRKGGAGPGAKRRGGGPGGGGGRKKGSQQRPLCRPIICICNDLYAPALRPLRDVARVFHFSPPASERLAARLSQICQAERLEADPAALRLLVERTDRDVRACLNTLQFLARRGAAAAGGAATSEEGSGRLTIDVKDIESLNIASKDTTQSAMDVWTLLLTTGAQGRKRGPASLALGGGSAATQLGELCNRLQDFGDYDLVLNGLHENLPRVRFMDINLGRTAAVEDAMGLADYFLRSARRTGDFSCLRFVPPLLAQVRAIVAQPERPRQLTWPRLGGEAARRASAASQLVRSWASSRGTDPSVLTSHGMTVMMLELAPALRALASHQPIRAVAPNMMTADEQAALRRTAGLMLHYGLRYCFEQPTPPGLQPLQLPEVVAPVSSNAIILGLTAEVQKNLAAAAGAAAGAAGGSGFQRQPQQPYGGRGPGGGFQGGRGGRGQYNSYGQGRGPGGDGGFRCPHGAAGRGAPGGQSAGGPGQTAGPSAPAGPVRHVPLVPAIDTLHFFTAFGGAGTAVARATVPHVVRQMISQHTEMEAIRRAEAARASVTGVAAPNLAPSDAAVSPVSAGRSHGPLQPVAPPPQRQMAGRMPPGAENKKGGAAGAAGVKRKGTWLDAFKQQASVKARGGVGSGASAGATARKAAEEGADAAGGAAGTSPQNGAAAAPGRGKLQFPVLYRFNEGYTNAVKRPLLMRELL